MSGGVAQRLGSSGVLSGNRWVTAEGLAKRARRAASILHELGVVPGSHVALLMRNDIAFFEATLAASMLGAATVPINTHLTAPEISYIVTDCDAILVIGHADLLTAPVRAACNGRRILAIETPSEVARAYGINIDSETIPPEVWNWDLVDAAEEWPHAPVPTTSTIFYTSGTTGQPKGVVRQPVSPDAKGQFEARAARAFGLEQPVRSVMTGPLYHSAPNAYAMRIVNAGGFLVLQPRFSAEELLRLVEQHAITHLHMVPTMFVRLLALAPEIRTRHSLSTLKNIVHGAAPCAPELKRAMIDWLGPIINEYYAMTETGIITTCSIADWLRYPGSVGKPATGVELRILREEGSDAEPGSHGEICVRTEVSDAIGYHAAEAKTKALRREGFIATGDVGYRNADGYLFLAGRKSDTVISAGVNIYPAEVEHALLAMPAVRDSAVFGIPDALLGEKLVAIIEAPGIDATQVRDFLNNRIANYKIPKEILFRQALPREDSGKIKKRHLRDEYLQALAGQSPSCTSR